MTVDKLKNIKTANDSFNMVTITKIGKNKITPFFQMRYYVLKIYVQLEFL